MRGPGIRKDEWVWGANLLDVVPTVLHLLGLPVGEDMDGRVLLEAFEETGRPARIPSWEEDEDVCPQKPPPEPEFPHSVTVYRGLPSSDQTAVQQVIFENPHSRNVVELRGSPVVQADTTSRRNQPRARTPVPNTRQSAEPGVQGKPAFDGTEVE